VILVASPDSLPTYHGAGCAFVYIKLRIAKYSFRLKMDFVVLDEKFSQNTLTVFFSLAKIGQFLQVTLRYLQ
jgi:hypothetical protein